jgi:hypothetical protein
VNFSQPSLKKVHFLSGPDIQISTGAVSATSRKRRSLSRSTPSAPFGSVLLARNARVLCFLSNSSRISSLSFDLLYKVQVNTNVSFRAGT